MPAFAEKACTTGRNDAVARAGASSVMVQTMGAHAFSLSFVDMNATVPHRRATGGRDVGLSTDRSSAVARVGRARVVAAHRIMAPTHSGDYCGLDSMTLAQGSWAHGAARTCEPAQCCVS